MHDIKRYKADKTPSAQGTQQVDLTRRLAQQVDGGVNSSGPTTGADRLQRFNQHSTKDWRPMTLKAKMNAGEGSSGGDQRSDKPSSNIPQDVLNRTPEKDRWKLVRVERAWKWWCTNDKLETQRISYSQTGSRDDDHYASDHNKIRSDEMEHLRNLTGLLDKESMTLHNKMIATSSNIYGSYTGLNRNEYKNAGAEYDNARWKFIQLVKNKLNGQEHPHEALFDTLFDQHGKYKGNVEELM